MPIIHPIFPQSRTIAHPFLTTPMSNHEHLGQNMIAFRETTTFFTKTMIAFRRKPHIHPSIPTKARKNHPNHPNPVAAPQASDFAPAPICHTILRGHNQIGEGAGSWRFGWSCFACHPLLTLQPPRHPGRWPPRKNPMRRQVGGGRGMIIPMVARTAIGKPKANRWPIREIPWPFRMSMRGFGQIGGRLSGRPYWSASDTWIRETGLRTSQPERNINMGCCGWSDCRA